MGLRGPLFRGPTLHALRPMRDLLEHPRTYLPFPISRKKASGPTWCVWHESCWKVSLASLNPQTSMPKELNQDWAGLWDAEEAYIRLHRELQGPRGRALSEEERAILDCAAERARHAWLSFILLQARLSRAEKKE